MKDWTLKDISDSSVYVREHDGFGEGHYGASRGSRKHSGIDVVTWCDLVRAPFKGTILREARPYNKTKSIEKQNMRGLLFESHDKSIRLKMFYVSCSHIGAEFYKGDTIGIQQTLQIAYPPSDTKEMTDHIHVEVYEKRKHKWIRVNPTKYFR